jgi:hypothetical protein
MANRKLKTRGFGSGSPTCALMLSLTVDTHVSSNVSINPCIDMYTIGKDESEAITKPFIHPVGLKGKKGITSKIEGLFDDGTLVNSICSKKFALLWHILGAPTP